MAEEGTSLAAETGDCKHLPSGTSTPSSVSGRGLEGLEGSILSSEAKMVVVVMLVISVLV